MITFRYPYILGRFTSIKTGLQGFLARKDTLLGMNARNLEIIFPHNQRRDFPLVDDKVVAKELMIAAGIAVPRTYDVLEGFPDLSRLDHILASHEEFVLKPACGSGGKGIFLAAERAPGGVRTASGRFVTRDAVRQHMAETLFGNFSTNRSDRVLVEERLHPHPFFRDFYPVGLADIRVIVFRRNPVMSMLRLPTKKSGGTANLHQGGVGVGIEISTGRTLRAVCRGDSLLKHPDSGRALLDAVIPAWKSIIAVASSAAARVPLGYVGVDIVMGPDERPIVLELNARPGLQIQNATGIGLRGILSAGPVPC
ncbi:MAG: hypothetical protein M3Y08_16010 [Fibrobacterota bacterium]|nr:hypothetical protein [Fibrobacterota bacterium]